MSGGVRADAVGGPECRIECSSEGVELSSDFVGLILQEGDAAGQCFAGRQY